jgi:hypothetical protein
MRLLLAALRHEHDQKACYSGAVRAVAHIVAWWQVLTLYAAGQLTATSPPLVSVLPSTA